MGELQKRIESLLKSEDWFGKWHDSPYALFDTIQEIVGEMTSEFPELLYVDKNEATAEDILRYVESINMWRKKWLMPVAQKSKSEEK